MAGLVTCTPWRKRWLALRCTTAVARRQHERTRRTTELSRADKGHGSIDLVVGSLVVGLFFHNLASSISKLLEMTKYFTCQIF